MARELPSNIHLGTSSWSFPGWQGIVYDRRVTKTHLARHGPRGVRGPCLAAGGGYRPDVLCADSVGRRSPRMPRRSPTISCSWSRLRGECTSPYRRDSSGKPVGKNPTYLDPGWATDAVVRPFAEGLARQGRRVGVSVSTPGQSFSQRTLRALLTRLGRVLFQVAAAGFAYAVELRDGELFCANYLDAR